MQSYFKDSHGEWWAVEHGSDVAKALKTVRTVEKVLEYFFPSLSILLRRNRTFLSFKTLIFLLQHFEITGIPSLVVLKASDGSLVTKDGRSAVQSKGPAALADWK